MGANNSKIKLKRKTNKQNLETEISETLNLSKDKSILSDFKDYIKMKKKGKSVLMKSKVNETLDNKCQLQALELLNKLSDANCPNINVISNTFVPNIVDEKVNRNYFRQNIQHFNAIFDLNNNSFNNLAISKATIRFNTVPTVVTEEAEETIQIRETKNDFKIKEEPKYIPLQMSSELNIVKSVNNQNKSVNENYQNNGNNNNFNTVTQTIKKSFNNNTVSVKKPLTPRYNDNRYDYNDENISESESHDIHINKFNNSHLKRTKNSPLISPTKVSQKKKSTKGPLINIKLNLKDLIKSERIDGASSSRFYNTNNKSSKNVIKKDNLNTSTISKNEKLKIENNQSFTEMIDVLSQTDRKYSKSRSPDMKIKPKPTITPKAKIKLQPNQTKNIVPNSSYIRTNENKEKEMESTDKQNDSVLAYHKPIIKRGPIRQILNKNQEGKNIKNDDSFNNTNSVMVEDSDYNYIIPDKIEKKLQLVQNEVNQKRFSPIIESIDDPTEIFKHNNETNFNPVILEENETSRHGEEESPNFSRDLSFDKMAEKKEKQKVLNQEKINKLNALKKIQTKIKIK